MKRRKKILSAMLILATSGCAGPETGPEAMVLGTLMVLVGVAVAVALVLSLSD